ncbi:MAG: lasso peptide biosynthesis B2 protein, partial [Roseiflexaceae bacterium]
SSTCLVQALATQRLLKRFGEITQVRIGVRHDQTGQFKAHAWVEHHGQILIGGSAEEIALFTVLPSLD